MSTLSQAYTIEHHSNLIRYIHPYILTHDSDLQDIHVWACTKYSAPLYSGTLEGKIPEPVEIHLLPPSHLITRTVSEEGGYGLHELLLHELPSGKILDRLRLGKFDATGKGESCLIGVAEGTLIIWRNGGSASGDGQIETYIVDEEGKISRSDTLYPPANSPDKPSVGLNGTFRGELLHFAPGSLLEMPSETEFPIGVYIARWSSNRDRASYRSFTFSGRVTPPEDEKWVSHLRAHVLAGGSSIVTAHYEYPFGIAEQNPTTSIRSININTLKLNWVTIIEQKTNQLRYLPSYGIVVAIGIDSRPVGIRQESMSCISVVILDESNGLIRATHPIHLSQNPCSGISRAEGGIEVGIMGSREELAILFGDGQSILVPINQFVTNGFETSTNDSGYFNTILCPETKFGTPKNSKERKNKEKGRWGWVHQALIGDKQIILESEGRGFVVL